jgi:hypothetical protein
MDRRGLSYAAIYVTDTNIAFNSKTIKLFDAPYVRISTKAPYLFFEPTSARSGSFEKHKSSSVRGFVIYGRNLIVQSWLKPGYYYRLYRTKRGSYAVKVNEAMTKEEALGNGNNQN